MIRFIYFLSLFQSYVSRLPKAGETITGKKFNIGFGGKGANQCVCSSRLGAKACMVGKVGNDTFGTGMIQNFKENNVNVDYVSTTEEAFTGAAPIAVNDEGQNSIIVILGANLLLSVEDINAAESLISSSKVVVCQLEIKPETTLAALKLAKKHNVKSIFNPAPAQSGLSDEYFTACDYFCPNETEAEILSGVPVKCIKDAEKAIEIFLEKGCKTVIITMGELGAVFASQENKTPVHVPATPVTAVDTTVSLFIQSD
ncbi:hypothetical protein KUTeg_013589 [Tegillarca granosa]|uniref:Carbohydrate kinase PfkB domain-containing protein n=1 Tax=Tegillarca granosa TaxID=220873 RepID=A0ABQ9EZ95_TEGGR|nr:hypothetical protein KUTeg_013589 [Tegillarca granosa]